MHVVSSVSKRVLWVGVAERRMPNVIRGREDRSSTPDLTRKCDFSRRHHLWFALYSNWIGWRCSDIGWVQCFDQKKRL